MKKMVNKIIVFMLVMLAVVIIPHNTEAALQANKATQTNPSKKYFDAWIKEVRKMEAENQAMGLSETINESTLKASSNSNNIDVHMIKTTEWGTVAILSASGYGNSEPLSGTNVSTTGNNSGVFFNVTDSSYEWNAGGVVGTTLYAIDKRYYDEYTTDKTKTKSGDALGDSNAEHPGCAKWHGAGNVAWPTGDEKYFRRNYNSFFGYSNSASNYASFSRAVAVCGDGI